MPTECSLGRFEFARVEGRDVVASFDGGRLTSDAGALLLGAADRVIGLTEKLAACFSDARNPALVEHAVATLVMQRVVGIALGYEDLNDHDELRHDPVLATLAGKLTARRGDCAPLAGKSTLNRLELSRAVPTRYASLAADSAAIERLFVEWFLDAHQTAPEQITLDLDATDDPLHGHQEGRFFHGYYDCYCYLPLYVFCGRHLLAAKLRPANIDASAGTVEEVARIGPGEIAIAPGRRAGGFRLPACGLRIKECQLDLFADRTSAATMRANQLRLWFASAAYVLLCALRRIGLTHTRFATATCGTIRLRLLKVGALVRLSVRRVSIAMASACPVQQEFAQAYEKLRMAAA